MLGYSDSGKDAGRLAAVWALYKCQESIVEVRAVSRPPMALPPQPHPPIQLPTCSICM